MANVSEVFNAAMGLMDELSSTGAAQTSDTKEYEYRTPAIVNQMVAEHNILSGAGSKWVPVEGLEDYIKVDNNYALGVMNYGLAANLLVDENPTAAGFFQQRYEELRNLYMTRKAAEVGAVEDMYGLNEYNEFSRW